MRAIALCSLAIGASIVSFAQSSPTKVGVINIQAAIAGTREGQTAVKELEGKSAPKKQQLEKAQAEIKALQEQLNKTSSVGSDEQKQRLMRDIDTRTKQFNRQVEDAQAELDQDQQRILNELGGKMLTVLDKYAKDNGYSLIIDISNQNTPVLFAANNIDVTNEVVALYDKNAPAAGGATAAPATGGAAAPSPSKPAATKPAAPKPGPAK